MKAGIPNSISAGVVANTPSGPRLHFQPQYYMTKKTFDFFILGTGPAGGSIAVSARKAGHSVGICDPIEYGGACPNRGCDPKKVLYAAAKATVGAQRLMGKGFVEPPKTSWSDLMTWKRTFTEHIPPATHQKFTEKGIECFEGKAMFTGPGKVIIGDHTEIEARHVVIATGAKPAPLDIPGKEYYLDSAGFLDMDDLPDRLLIIGSGISGPALPKFPQSWVLTLRLLPVTITRWATSTTT